MLFTVATFGGIAQVFAGKCKCTFWVNIGGYGSGGGTGPVTKTLSGCIDTSVEADANCRGFKNATHGPGVGLIQCSSYNGETIDYRFDVSPDRFVRSENIYCSYSYSS